MSTSFSELDSSQWKQLKTRLMQFPTTRVRQILEQIESGQFTWLESDEHRGAQRRMAPATAAWPLYLRGPTARPTRDAKHENLFVRANV